jgi:hypothetical protein
MTSHHSTHERHFGARKNAMRNRLTKLALPAALSMVAMAANCFSITDPFVVSVNVKDVTGTYDVDANTVNFDPSCSVKQPADYIDPDYQVQPGGRLVDITIQTIGTFAGNVVNGEVRVNGTTILSYSGPWSTFNTAQSILSSTTPLVQNPAGVAVLLSAIQGQQPISICHAGAFSQASPPGLQIQVKVFAQVDVQP